MSSPPLRGPFFFGERLGIFLTIEASFLSAASVTLILCYALFKRLRSTLYTLRSKDLRLGRPSDATSSDLFLNLMLADLIQAIGGFPNIRWMSAGAVLPGRMCTAQAIFKQIGIVGVSMTSLAIALHTFSVLVLRWRGPPNFPKYVIIGIWAFTAFDIVIANVVHRHEVYYGVTGYWCWILPQFQAERIVTEYLWVWLAAFFMTILYGIMFAIIHQWINVAHGIQWYNQPPGDTLDMDSDDEKKIKAVANSMLLYPAVYILCFLPNTLSRWLYFEDLNKKLALPPYQFTLFASSIYGLSGLFNLILFLITRPKVVVGHPVSPTKDAAVLPGPIHVRHNLRRKHLDYDIENPSRPGSSTYEFQSPSRTMHRIRSPYDMEGISNLPSSPTRNVNRWSSSSDVLDIV